MFLCVKYYLRITRNGLLFLIIFYCRCNRNKFETKIIDNIVVSLLFLLLLPAIMFHIFDDLLVLM